MANIKRKDIKSFVLYFIVGALATIVEWILFYLLNTVLHFHYSISTIIAFAISTFANWGFGRLLVFKKGSGNLKKEITQIYIVAIIGLSMNLLIMWVGVDLLGFNEMLTKIAATCIVFFWNYIIRKLVIYREPTQKSE